MKRKNYLSPSTFRSRIEVESAFCGASSKVTNPNDNGGIDEHSINTGFGGHFIDSGWDIDPTNTTR